MTDAYKLEGAAASGDSRTLQKEVENERVQLVNKLLFDTPGGTRFTLDGPILPTVWLLFATAPYVQHELILSTANQVGTGKAADVLRRRLLGMRAQRPTVWDPETGQDVPRQRARVAYIPGQIAAKLYFDELMRVVLPMTPWWHDAYDRLRDLQHKDKARRAKHDLAPVSADWQSFPRPEENGRRRRDIVAALMLLRRDIDPTIDDIPDGDSGDAIDPERINYLRSIPSDLLWLVRIGGLIAEVFEKHNDFLAPDSHAQKIKLDFDARRTSRIETTPERAKRLAEKGVPRGDARRARDGIVAAFEALFDGWSQPEEDNVDAKEFPSERFVWRVTKNRRIHLAVAQSALTVKADAARSLFNISCQGITWAVLDSGIDRHHPAFKLTTTAHEQDLRRRIDIARSNGETVYRIEDKVALEVDDGEASQANTDAELKKELNDDASMWKPLPEEECLPVDHLKSRVIKTLDFTYLRELLDYDLVYHHRTRKGMTEKQKQADAEARAIADAAAEERQKALQHKIACRMSSKKCLCDLGQECTPEPALQQRAEDFVELLRDRIKKGQDISWQDLEAAIDSANPSTPTNDHGTHVAGILGADWIEDIDHEEHLPLPMRARRMTGICRDINLIDVRVFREDGLTDEFELLAALQYLRWMNSRAGTMQVHGANLSLSLIHEVRRFACGQTPICHECNEASSLGMTIVASAGNRGFEQGEIDAVRASDGYREVSITDPGNADKVITVGATHRKRPHEYGVSYFSSRGPTGDGRLKPDLVAPGEKIQGPTPNGSMSFKDGTSMAAPHVSGAAALLMARHSELIGQPERIKEILCETATDLGRERYFQGHGLVDVLRAIQSV